MMDEFAQSRGDDDLFDDEIVPIEPGSRSVQEVPAQPPSAVSATVTAASVKQSASEKSSTFSARSRGRGRGRAGQTRDQPKHNDLANSKWSSKPGAPKPIPSNPSPTATESVKVTKDNAESQIPAGDEESTGKPQLQPPTGPSNPTVSRPPAVRGDRTNTGGIARPKLTEAQLAEKLQAAKERSQNLAAAHARAQADAENFAERERMASQKRAKETAERKVMEGERERNRERKLKGQGGREWDAKKQEDDFAGRGRGGSSLRRGFGPGEAEEEQDLSIYEWQEDRGRGRGRGRGGRGQRSRGGRGDARGNNRAGNQQKQPDLIDDFPALPATKDQRKAKAPDLQRQPSETVDVPAGTSWADQVESSEAARVAS